MTKHMKPEMSFAPSRRDFMIGTGLGLIIGFTFDATTRSAQAEINPATAASINAYVQIDAASNVKIYIGSSDMGQGIMTAMAQLVAEELCLDRTKFATQVSVETGTPDQNALLNGAGNAPYSKPSGYTSQSTGGSTSMRSWYKPMRTAGVAARLTLIQAYRDMNGMASTDKVLVSGGVLSAAGKTPVQYGQVVAWVLSRDANNPPYPYTFIKPTVSPTDYVSSANYQFIGSDIAGSKIVKRTDIPDKVTGKAKFGIDIRLPGMVYATVIHSPTIATAGSTLSPTLPANPTGRLLVPLLNERRQYNSVGVVDISTTSNTWSAMQTAKSIRPTWIADTSVDSVKIDSSAGLVNGVVQTTTGLLNTGTPQFVKSSDGYFTVQKSASGYNASSLGAAKLIAIDPTITTVAASSKSNLDACEAVLTTPTSTAVVVDQAYYTPFVAHAPMEVVNCTVLISPDTVSTYAVEIWAPTQSATACIKTVQSFLGSSTKVMVHTTYLGGGLGRKIDQDFILQAIQIAKALYLNRGSTSSSVKVTWTRPDDFKNDRYRPSSLMRVRIGLDSKKKLTALRYRNVTTSLSMQKTDIMNAWNKALDSLAKPAAYGDDTGALAGALEGPSGTATTPPYAVPVWRTEVVPNNDVALPPLGFWRSVGESYNVFAIESAIDELAFAAGITDKTAAKLAAFRIGLLDTADATELKRCTDVINGALALAGALPTGSARGIAFMKGFGSIVAVVAEVSATTTTPSNVKVNKLYCAVDCGLAVNKDGVRAQIEGGLLHGVSATLYSKVTFKSGVPYNGSGSAPLSNFNNYALLKLSNSPAMSISIIDGAAATEAVGGVGEVGVPCVAPAVANAWFALTGKRVRAMPFYPGATMGGL